MDIVVCIKQVPGTTEVKINEETNTLVREGVEAVINPFDTYAVEEAVRLRERYGGRVVVLTMGPPQAEEANMPYKIEVRDGEYCVVRADTGEVEKCHESEDDAQAIWRRYGSTSRPKRPRPRLVPTMRRWRKSSRSSRRQTRSGWRLTSNSSAARLTCLSPSLARG